MATRDGSAFSGYPAIFFIPFHRYGLQNGPGLSPLGTETSIISPKKQIYAHIMTKEKLMAFEWADFKFGLHFELKLTLVCVLTIICQYLVKHVFPK